MVLDESFPISLGHIPQVFRRVPSEVTVELFCDCVNLKERAFLDYLNSKQSRYGLVKGSPFSACFRKVIEECLATNTNVVSTHLCLEGTVSYI